MRGAFQVTEGVRLFTKVRLRLPRQLPDKLHRSPNPVLQSFVVVNARRLDQHPPLHRPAGDVEFLYTWFLQRLMALLGIQMILGLSTWAIKAGGFVRSHESPLLQIVTISAHVAVGAALLATSLGVTLMCHRGSAPAPARLEASPA